MPDLPTGTDAPRTLEKVVRGLGQTRCAVGTTQLLIAPPLIRSEFARHMWPLWPWWPRRYREFAREYITPALGYTGRRRERQAIQDAFSKYFAQPACSILASLRKSQPDLSIRPDATFRHFCGAVEDPGVSLAIVVAHHAIGAGGPEFADGVYSWESVYATIDAGVQRFNLIQLICSTDNQSRGAFAESEQLGSVGFAMCPLPFLQCLRFAADLVHSLSPDRSLEECWADAETRFLQRVIKVTT